VRLYLDAAPVIYVVEDIHPYGARVQTYLATPGVEVVATDLTRLESRVGPLRRGDSAMLSEFDQFFATTVKEIVPLSRAVLDRATEIRAQFGFPTPDAIHIAAALVGSCDVLLTNDQRLNRPVGIRVQII
jgi:predicted nucleic acid-binding protein